MEGDASIPQPGERQPPGRVFVVLPAYNEEGALHQLLSRIDRTLSSAGLRYEIVLVDDGSSDGTRGVADELSRHMPIRVVSHGSNQGLGAAVRDGLREAVAACHDRDVVVVMDADDTHTPVLIPEMTRKIQDGADVVIASREKLGAQVRGVPAGRRLLSWVGNRLFRLFLPIRGVRDYTCGYRAYRGMALRRAFGRYGGAFIDQEGFQSTVDILLKLRRLDLVFTEVPLTLRYDRKRGPSKMKVGRTIYKTLRLMLLRRLGA